MTSVLRTGGWLAVALLVLLPAVPAEAQVPSDVVYSQHHKFRVATVATGLEHPWGIAFLPDESILVTERAGRLRIVRDGRLLDEPVQGIPEANVQGQGGLLDVALHPDFASNRLVYLSYSKPLDGGATTTAVVRGELDGTRLVNVEEVFAATRNTSPGRHYGGRIVFDHDGYLFLSIGDGGAQNQAQDITNHVGTVVRLHDDGSVPSDNPFTGQGDALPEIYTYGNRNPQGMAVHPVTGDVWQNEHGPRGGDELNHVHAGGNYGWPEITHGINYNGSVLTADTARAGMDQPIHHWTPSIAVSGLDFYTGDQFPEWEGDAFVGALRQQHIQRIRLDGFRVAEQEILLFNLQRRFREVKTGPDGYLYLLTDQPDGEVLRLEPTTDAH